MGKKSSKRPVLVCIDFSNYAELTLEHGATWAKATGSKLLLLHVVHEPARKPGFYREKEKKKDRKKLIKTMVQAAEELLEEFLAEAKDKYPQFSKVLNNAETMLVNGTPVTRIVEVAEEQNAGMIILGSHGKTGAARLLLGSKAGRVVHLSPVPILIVKTDDEGAEA